MPELRRSRPEDFEQLWALDQRCFSRDIAYSRRELACYLGHRSAICLVASEAREVQGFILGQLEPRGFGHIITLDVEPSARRSGLGSTLMRALEERLLSAGCTSIFLEVAVNNRTALTFYKRHGYSVLKTLRRYYPGDLDGLLMAKSIDSSSLAAGKKNRGRG